MFWIARLTRRHKPARPQFQWAAWIVFAVGMGVRPDVLAFAQDAALSPAQKITRPQFLESPDARIPTRIPAPRDLKQTLLAQGVNFQRSGVRDTFGDVGGVQQAAACNSTLYIRVNADLEKPTRLSGANQQQAIRTGVEGPSSKDNQ